MTTTIRISDKSRELLQLMKEHLPGNPSLSKLTDEAIHDYYKQLQQKYNFHASLKSSV